MNNTEQFKSELESLLNRYSQENASNTPDFILAEYLLRCLHTWNVIVQQREIWYGRDPYMGPASISGGDGPVPVDPRENR